MLTKLINNKLKPDTYTCNSEGGFAYRSVTTRQQEADSSGVGHYVHHFNKRMLSQWLFST